jgi:hypothetical protein
MNEIEGLPETAEDFPEIKSHACNHRRKLEWEMVKAGG